MWKVDCRDGCNDLILLSSTNLERTMKMQMFFPDDQLLRSSSNGGGVLEDISGGGGDGNGKHPADPDALSGRPASRNGGGRGDVLEEKWWW